ncbi:hypothetical protein LTR62_000768 [Meristemomyces frigidus]|uniref:RNA 3'-terminal phosphate cyclase domain-containing protein n=1 Tax=Meristemomyces frigidus TaxID=1508187 RepID=A0AAN7TTC1_9PEZI|nr:hypothetical protein LTR62_000768 [Meristemomyces frigidus]
MPKIKHLHLDGRTLEGGGQLLCLAICISALTTLPLKINDIRGNRAGGGGLKAQHLASVDWLAQACNANVEGSVKGSRKLVFEPGRGKGRACDVSASFKKMTLADGRRVWEARIDIGTAGSTGLALQAVLPFILFTKLPPSGSATEEETLPIHLTLSGGTNVSGSPSYEYISQVLLPTLYAIGLPDMKTTLLKRGWSQGGTSIGSFTLEIPARKDVMLPAFRLTSTHRQLCIPTHLRATFIAPSSCHEQLKSTLVPFIRTAWPAPAGGSPIPITIACEDSKHDKRLYLLLVATVPNRDYDKNDGALSAPKEYLLASDWLYERKIDRVNLGQSHEEAVAAMVHAVFARLDAEWKSGAWVDEHLRDQLIIFQALAQGKSEVCPGWEVNGLGLEAVGLEARQPSLHAETAGWVVEQMLGVRADGGGGCEGVGINVEGQVDWRQLLRRRERERAAQEPEGGVRNLAVR